MRLTALLPAFALYLLALPACGVAAAQARTGAFEETLALEDALGPDGMAEFGAAFRKDAGIAFSLYVPETYDPVRPAGILTYISPTRSGAIPPGWKQVAAERNLIWVSVNGSGNRRKSLRRVAEALAATAYVRTRYSTDETRTYLAGFSGGGRMASIIAYYYPAAYDGLVYICGVNTFAGEDAATIARMRENRYVFLTGRYDMNRQDTKDVYRTYSDAGFERAKLVDIRDLAHDLPSARAFRNAVDWLDAKALPSPEDTR